MKKILQKAIKDTWHFLGGWTVLVPLFAVAPVGFLLHWLQAPEVEVAEEWKVFAVYGLQAGGVVFFVTFLINLLCAPFRLEREKNIALESEVSASARIPNKVLQSREFFTLREAACLLASTPVILGELVGPAATVYLDLRARIIDGSLKVSVVDSMQLSILKSKRNWSGLSGLLPHGELSEVITPSVEIKRDQLVKLTREYDVFIEGLTDESRVPLSLQDTETKTPR